jgi:hypothetical protein
MLLDEAGVSEALKDIPRMVEAEGVREHIAKCQPVAPDVGEDRFVALGHHSSYPRPRKAQ